MEAHDVPSSSISLWSASMKTSVSKQGFVSCHCKRYCIDKKRKRHSKNMKCHSNSSCKNKWALSLLLIRPMLHVFLSINYYSYKQFIYTVFRVVAVSLMPQCVVVIFSAHWAFSIFDLNIPSNSHDTTFASSPRAESIKSHYYSRGYWP
jgi:hypothetical protein